MTGFKCRLAYIKSKCGFPINSFAGNHILNCPNNSKVVSKKTYKYKSFDDLMNRKIEITPANFTVIFLTVIFRKFSKP